MKKILELVGIISLIGFSFFFTDKTARVVKEMDSLMTEIKKASETVKTEPVDAKIVNNTIIPGISGKAVDENKSYYNMKRLGSFNESLLIYKEIKPKITIYKNYNYYIVKGNPNKKTVSLIFKLNENDNPDNIIKILDNYSLKANFFVDGLWFESNNEKVIDIINMGHNIGNMSYNLDYNNSSFIWMNTMISKIGKQKTKFCYNEIENENTLKNCSLQSSYTIKPNIIIKTNPLIEVKQSLTPGSIVSFNINETTIKELPLIIEYIKSKDLKIVPLIEHIKE